MTVIIPPNDLKFPDDDLTDSSFKLTWTYLRGSEPIAKFVFHYGKFTKEAGPQDSSLIVSGLESCETYEVYGLAEGLKGQVSKLSDVVSVTTRPSPLGEGKYFFTCKSNGYIYFYSFKSDMVRWKSSCSTL